MQCFTCRQMTGLITGLLVLCMVADLKGAEQSILRLTNGDTVVGSIVDTAQPETLAWQSPWFTTPLQFTFSGLNSINLPVADKLVPPVGDFCFELERGDLLFGSLVSLDATEFVVDVTPVGRLHLDASLVRRIYRWNADNDLVYFGPSGLSGWEMSGAARGWREEAGHLFTKQAGDVIRRRIDVPPMARLELELSWSGKPDFEFALVTEAGVAQSFRFDVWDSELVAVRDTDREADVALIKTIKAGVGRVQLQLFLDQPHERLLVFSPAAEPLADLAVGSRKPLPVTGVQLTNRTGTIRLERLRISHWNGDLPHSGDADKTRIHQADGSIVYGQLKSYDAERRVFQVADGSTVRAIAADRIRDVFLSRVNEAPAQMCRLVFLDGQQISGTLQKVEDGVVWMTSAGIREALRAPVASLKALVMLPQRVDVSELPGREGRLELDGMVLHGCLVDGRETDAGCLVWQSRYTRSANALVRGLAGRIVYRDPPAVAQATPDVQAQAEMQAVPAGGLVGQIINAFGGTVVTTKPATKPHSKASGPVLHLRSGDKIPCKIFGIDEEGVTLSSPVTDATFVKHDQIKVLELIPDVSPVSITKPKKERLLMLPRMQRDNPPTQLFRSVTGDYLRGRLIAMDAHEIKMEVRLEEKSIRRESVARIIWLHPEEMKTGAQPETTSEQPAATRVQAVPRDGNRLTFLPEQFEGQTLSGRSEILGGCRVEILKLDQLLIGAAIDQAASSLAFHQWRLKHAADPLASAEDSGGDSGEGRESALVGKPAPDIELGLLDGSKFRLADYRGKILILDFWASWCGPCLQAMPQVDSVAREFADRNVVLVAVNLEETADRIKAALTRLKLESTVALDSNGRVAERYGVTSIPQTVIVDADGKVVRLFVGAGARFGDQLRAALESVVGPRLTRPESDPAAGK